MTVLGVDRDVVERLGVWRSEWGSGASRREVADLVAPGSGLLTLRGVTSRTGELQLAVGPNLVSFEAVVETPDGDFRRVELGSANADRGTVLAGRVPPGSRLVSLEVRPPPRLIEGGANAGIAFSGSVALSGSLGRRLRSWVGIDGVEVRRSESGIELRYVLTPQRIGRIRARQATDATPPNVVVSPRLAELAGGVGGSLPLRVAGAVVPVRIAGVVERFPGTEDDVVVGDRSALTTAVNAAAPGSARENEVWLDASDEQLSDTLEALGRPPFHVLDVATRAGLEEEARRDPLAHGTLLALGAAALMALVLAAIGLALAVRADLRDDRSELYELEAQGASPSLLRRVIRSRALAVAVAGLLAGAVTGAALVTLVTRVVSVTARGGFAEPPLAPTVDPFVVCAGVAAYALLAGLLVGVMTRRAFQESRGPVAERL